jgi:hypothetical protein
MNLIVKKIEPNTFLLFAEISVSLTFLCPHHQRLFLKWWRQIYVVVEIGEVNMQQLVGVVDLGDVRVNFGKASCRALSCRVYFDKVPTSSLLAVFMRHCRLWVLYM